MNSHPARGFSLVELSIVLVIVGLLVGGVLAGKSLVRAGEIKSITADAANYSAAVNAFYSKYDALPGDMKNATRYWGSAGGTGSDATCDAALTATSPAICNGDGDGRIETALPVAVMWNERFYAWKELANAGLIGGNYTGRTVGAPGDPDLQGGVDTPLTRLQDAVFNFHYRGIVTAATGDLEWFVGNYNFNAFYVGNGQGNAGTSTNPPFRPDEVYNIDKKFDDGRPGTGKVYAGRSTGTYMPGCTTTDDPATAAYSVRDKRKICSFFFALQ